VARSFAAASSQFLYVASNLGITAEPFTFACWGQSSDAANNQNLMAFSRSASDSGVYLLAMRGSVAGDPIAAIKQNDAGTASAFANTTTGYSTGSWHSACAVFESTTSRTASIDGGSSGTNTTSVSAVTGFEFSIGAAYPRLTTRAYLSGYVAFPAVWNVALSAAEVLMLAKGAHPFSVRPDNLIAFWPLDEKTGGARDVVGGYNLTASASEPTWVPDPPVLVRRPRRSKVWAGGSSGAQSLLPGLYVDADTFHAPTVSATYALSPSLYSDADSFYSATVSATYALTPGLYADADSFYSATVSGTYTIAPDLYVDSDAFYSPVVSLGGAQTLLPSLYVDADTFPSATVSATYTLAPGLYSDPDNFYGPTVSTTYALAPALYVDADTFHAPTVAPGVWIVSPGLYIDADAFYSPSVAPGAVSLIPSIYIDSDVFYPATLAGGSLLVPPFSASLSSIAAAAVLSSASARASLTNTGATAQ